MTELLPCPFCGKANMLKITNPNVKYAAPDNYFVVCSVDAGGCGASGGTQRTEAEAIAAWNRRAELGSGKPASDAIADLRETVREAFSGESVSMLVEGHAIMRAIDAVEAATLGSEREKQLEELVRERSRNRGGLMSDETTLLPCPFCGGEASKRLFYGTRHGVYCDECDARVGGLLNTEAEAIAAWNTRTHGTLTAEQVMAIAAKHQPDYCSDTHVCFDWQAIADELNGEMGSGTCEYVECGICKFYHADIKLCEYGIPPCSKFERKAYK